MAKLAQKLTMFLGTEIKPAYLYDTGKRDLIMRWLKDIVEYCVDDRKAEKAAKLWRRVREV